MQLPEAADRLLGTCRRVAPDWLRRSVVDTAAAAGVPADAFGEGLDEMVGRESERLVDALAALLATDVDEQGTNPLSLFRAATVGPTALLRAAGVPPAPPDEFHDRVFPDDPYRLGPAGWSDIDPDLHEPGLAWGAWKAMTVLRRRREQGLR